MIRRCSAGGRLAVPFKNYCNGIRRSNLHLKQMVDARGIIAAVLFNATGAAVGPTVKR